jgi:hypothetical protein
MTRPALRLGARRGPKQLPIDRLPEEEPGRREQQIRLVLGRRQLADEAEDLLVTDGGLGEPFIGSGTPGRPRRAKHP